MSYDDRDDECECGHRIQTAGASECDGCHDDRVGTVFIEVSTPWSRGEN